MFFAFSVFLQNYFWEYVFEREFDSYEMVLLDYFRSHYISYFDKDFITLVGGLLYSSSEEISSPGFFSASSYFKGP